MPKICLQAGHQNCQNNSIVSLRKSTGAPGEMAFNIDIRTRVAVILKSLGFEVFETDACANDNPTVRNTDWAAFISIHYDADIYGNGGGFADFPEPSTDAATVESQRIVKNLDEQYFPYVGIVNKPNRRNANTKYYYMWKYLTAKTPCAILECGVGQHKPDDFDTLQNNRQRVVEGIVKGIAKAFNVTYNPGTTPVPPTQPAIITDPKAKLDLGPEIGVMELQATTSTILDLRRDVAALQGNNKKLAEVKTNWQAAAQPLDNIKKLLA